MGDKKNIDRLFQEKFKDFEATPNDSVWNGISEELAGKKKKRRIIPIWWQIGGVAAAIVLLLTVGVAVFNSDSNPQNMPVVNTDKNQNEENNGNENVEITDPSLNKKQRKLNNTENNKVVENESSNHSNFNKNTSSNKKSDSKLTSNKTTSQSNNSVAENSKNSEQSNTAQTKQQLIEKSSNSNITVADNSSKTKASKTDDTAKLNSEKMKSDLENEVNKEKNAVADNSSSTTQDSKKSVTDKDKPEELLNSSNKKQSIEDALASNDDDPIIEKEEDEQNRWSIAPNVAPVYFSSLGQGSSLDNQFNENSKGSDINMSYGITGSYAVSKRLKVRAGINRLDLNQKTSGVFAFTSASTAARSLDAQYSNISFKDGVQSVSMISSKMISRSTAPEVFNTKTAGNIEQRFGFIEIPLELEYRLLDKKIGINVIGGFSTFFLNNNEIYADVDGASMLIGEANNINSTSFSANFGLGMDYSLSKQWNINLEPTFKYQINTFNNTTGNFKPFFIGVYTGLSFKF